MTMLFHNAKLELLDLTQLSKDALHVHISVLIVLLSCSLFKWRVASWRPWLLVLGLALLGEFWDVRYSIADHDPLHPLGNLKDILNTLAAPTLLMLAARYTGIFDRREKTPDISGDKT